MTAQRDHAASDHRSAEARASASVPPSGTEPLPRAANMLVQQPSGKVVAIDTTTGSLLDTDTDNLDKVDIRELFPELDEAEWNAVLHQNDKLIQTLSTTLRIKCGATQRVSLQFTPLSGPQTGGLLITIHFANTEVPKIGHRDALTGLPDRRELALRFDALQQTALNRARPVALLFMDLNHFKAVNDRFGHAIGDQLLVALAERWQSCVRDEDLVVRYGGDEFVVLLADIDCPADVQPVVDRLMSSTSQPIAIDQRQLQIGVTIGLAISGENTGGLEQLIIEADRDMYAAKQSLG